VPQLLDSTFNTFVMNNGLRRWLGG